MKNKLSSAIAAGILLSYASPQNMYCVTLSNRKGELLVPGTDFILSFRRVAPAPVWDIDGNGRLDILIKPYTRDAPRIDVWLNDGARPR
jgi:hypothetical protein